MTYYHITKHRHIESILAKGIVPGYRRGLCVNPGKLEHVYVTNNVKRILTTQAGNKWMNRNRIAVFEIDCEGLELQPVKYRDGATYTISDFEFMTTKIEISRLKFLEYSYAAGTIPVFNTRINITAMLNDG